MNNKKELPVSGAVDEREELREMEQSEMIRSALREILSSATANGNLYIADLAREALSLMGAALSAAQQPLFPVSDEEFQQIFDASLTRHAKDVLDVRAFQARLMAAMSAQQPSEAMPDGVREALQRLIENAATLGQASHEDALLVARHRDHAMQPSETAIHKPTIDAVAKALHALEVHDAGHPGTAFKVHGMCIEAVCALLRPAAQEAEKPHPVALTCPACGKPHIDEGEWATRPHKTHQCQYCKTEWRPFHHATVGVAQEAAREQPAPCDMGELCIGCTPRREDGGCPGERPSETAIWNAAIEAAAKVCRSEYELREKAGQSHPEGSAEHDRCFSGARAAKNCEVEIRSRLRPAAQRQTSTPEQFYDEQIAPQLAALAEECKERGLSLLAVCEWGPLQTGSTRLLQEDASISMKMSDAMAKANGNIDSFMFAMMRRAREHGHGSAILKQLGIPETPAKGEK